MKNYQIGSIETAQGTADVMLFRDADRPDEVMLHWWRKDAVAPRAVLASIHEHADIIECAVTHAYGVDEGGAIADGRLSHDEIEYMLGLRATFRKDGDTLVGEWTDKEGGRGSIDFRPAPDTHKLDAHLCEDWADFKAWASDVRRSKGMAAFRGHGDREFRLQTTLHRAGRHRLERYTYQTLPDFAKHAEAALNTRFNLGDATEFSTLL